MLGDTDGKSAEHLYARFSWRVQPHQAPAWLRAWMSIWISFSIFYSNGFTVCLSLIKNWKLRNVIQITSDFPTCDVVYGHRLATKNRWIINNFEKGKFVYDIVFIQFKNALKASARSKVSYCPGLCTLAILRPAIIVLAHVFSRKWRMNWGELGEDIMLHIQAARPTVYMYTKTMVKLAQSKLYRKLSRSKIYMTFSTIVQNWSTMFDMFKLVNEDGH